MKTMKRLTAITLVLLLLLSLCGCIAEELPEEESRPETTCTTAATTLSTTSTSAPTVIDTTASTAASTTDTTQTATQTATTVVTTQVTTKVTVTDPTAAPTTAVPTVKPLAEWKVMEGEAQEGPLPGTAIDFIKIKTFYTHDVDDFTENKLRDKECVIIEDKQQFDTLFTNVHDPEYTPGMSAQFEYPQDFFTDNVLVVLMRVSSDTNCGGYWITGISVNDGTLYTDIIELELSGGGGAALTPFYVLIELRREDVQGVNNIVVYDSIQTCETFEDYIAWREEHADMFY